ncbi:ABC transporter ATP-binding protein [Candidatus Poriferisodalis sp.]|uniref:ABC transporter ATP-binding protein n=1 Tax=Candidatus Poriferisodalis sp. TaxID=3101277 RepID=UPI003B012C85
MTAARLAIEVTQLCKRYGELEAVSGVDLTIATGEVVAFLGPNGAGKTTTVEILEGLRTATSGTLRVLGADPARAGPDWRERIGVVLQGATHEGDFTAEEIVTMWSAYYSAPRRPVDVLAQVGLVEASGMRTRRLSGGQRQRLAVALALVGNPELVFLDEPTTGFDPAARREAWQMIGGLGSLGVTVMLTTHYMDEADQLADRIIVISRGRIVADGTASELAARVCLPSHISWDAAELSRRQLPQRLADLLVSASTSDRATDLATDAATSPSTAAQLMERPAIATRDIDGVVRELLAAAAGAGVRLDSLAVAPPTLEDTYLALTRPASTGPTLAGPTSTGPTSTGPTPTSNPA